MFFKLFNVATYLFILTAIFATGCSKLTSSQTAGSGSSLQASHLLQASNVWISCAGESEPCTFTGTAVVAYGAGTSFAYKTFTGGTGCDIDAFGFDPDRDVVKSCYYLPVTTPTTKSWVSCAAESAECNFTGPAVVAYGAGTHFKYETFTSSTPCTIAAFGGDPDPDVLKSCYYIALSSPTAPAILPGQPGSSWVLCAAESAHLPAGRLAISMLSGWIPIETS
jgi:hypothetical protein